MADESRAQLVQSLKKRIAKVEKEVSANKKRVATRRAHLERLLDYVDLEIERCQKEPASPERDFCLSLHQLRRLVGAAGLELVLLLEAQNPNQPVDPRLVMISDKIGEKSRYYTMEYHTLLYRKTAVMLQEALAAGAARAPMQRTPSTRLQMPDAPPQGTGPLSARAAGRSGPPRSGTGPLNAPDTGPHGSGSLNALSTGALRGSGPLSAPGGTGPLSGSGPLNGGTGGLPGSGPLNPPSLADRLRRGAQDARMRPKMEQALNQYREIAMALDDLRGASYGEPKLTWEEVFPFIKQLAGKIYYLNRSLKELGPLGEDIAFEAKGGDPGLAQFLAQEASPPGKGGFSSMFKSLLGLQ